MNSTPWEENYETFSPTFSNILNGVGMSSSSWNSHNYRDGAPDDLYCILEQPTVILVRLILGLLGVPMHMFLCLALVLYRNKLQQSIMNYYGANVVFGNLIYLLCGLIDAIILYFGETRIPISQASSKQILLTFGFFIRSLLVITFLVISGGISMMILTLKRSFFRMHRTVAGMSTRSSPGVPSQKNSRRKMYCYSLRFWLRRNPKKRALIHILSSWIVPIVVGTVAMSDGKCLLNCKCFFGYISSNSTAINCPAELGCNPIFPPLSDVSVIVLFAAWFLYSAALILLLAQAFFNFRQVTAERRGVVTLQTRQNSVMAINQLQVASNKGDSLKTREPQTNNNNNGDNTLSPQDSLDINISSTTNGENGYECRTSDSSLLLQSLKKHLGFLAAVSIIFIIGTAIISVPVFSTSLRNDLGNAFVSQSDLVLIFSYAFAIILPAVNSILVCVSLVGMRTAVTSLIQKIFNCF